MNSTVITHPLAPYKLFIDGKWEEAVSGKSIPVINPATGEQPTIVPNAGAEEVDRGRAL